MPTTSRLHARIMGNLFVLLVLIVISVIYYPYVFVIWGPKIPGLNFCFVRLPIRTIESILAEIVLFFFHFFVLMLLWSLFKTIHTDPGPVPIYWVSILLEGTHSIRDFIWEILKASARDTV